MNFLLITLINLIIFNNGVMPWVMPPERTIIDKIKGVHYEYLRLVTEIKSLATQQIVNEIAEMGFFEIQIVDGNLKFRLSKNLDSQKFKEYIDYLIDAIHNLEVPTGFVKKENLNRWKLIKNFESIEKLKKRYENLIIEEDTDEFIEGLDKFESQDLTKQKINELKEFLLNEGYLEINKQEKDDIIVNSQKKEL